MPTKVISGHNTRVTLAAKQSTTAKRKIAAPFEAPNVRVRHTGFNEKMSFLAVYREQPLRRVKWIKEGLPATFLDHLSSRMHMPKERLLPALGIASATVGRKARESKPLSSDHSERALGMARLVGQVEAMVEESGEPDGFDAAQWVAGWLEEPLPALGGQCPADFIDSAEGQAIVSNLLSRMQTGAYA